MDAYHKKPKFMFVTEKSMMNGRKTKKENEREEIRKQMQNKQETDGDEAEREEEKTRFLVKQENKKNARKPNFSKSFFGFLSYTSLTLHPLTHSQTHPYNISTQKSDNVFIRQTRRKRS